MRSDTCEAQFIPVKKSGSGIGGFECGGGAGDSEELCFWARFYLAVEAGKVLNLLCECKLGTYSAKYSVLLGFKLSWRIERSRETFLELVGVEALCRSQCVFVSMCHLRLPFAGTRRPWCTWLDSELVFDLLGCLDYRSFMDTACDGAGIARTARTTIVIQLF